MKIIKRTETETTYYDDKHNFLCRVTLNENKTSISLDNVQGEYDKYYLKTIIDILQNHHDEMVQEDEDKE